MKRLIFAALFAGLFISCSSEDDGAVDDGTLSDYFPLSGQNSWTYDVEGSTASGRDSLYVSNDTVIGGNSHRKMKTRDLATGFFSGALKDNGIRNANGSIMISGAATLNLGDVLPIDLELSNFVILKDNASTNQELSSVSGTMQYVFETYPLDFEYALKSTAKETLPTFTSPEGTTYTDVKMVEMVLQLKISTINEDFGFPITVVILDTQNVLVSKSYYAANVGMVYTTTTISYNLQDLSQAGFDMPIPSSGTETQEELLDTAIILEGN